MFKALWILKIIYTEIRGDVKFKNRNSKTEIEMPKNSMAGVSPVQREGELEFGSKDIVKKKAQPFYRLCFLSRI